MANALDVARCLIRLAANEEEPDPLTHLRLQKLLYYVQGWSLAQRGQPLFLDRIEAWTHGPVVPSVYQVYRGRGWSSLFPSDDEPDIDLADEDRDYVAAVWEAFKGYSATSLREMTHQEPPWADARRGLGPAERCENEITHEALRLFLASGLNAMGKGKKPKPGRKAEFDSRESPPKPIHTKVRLSFEYYEDGSRHCLCHCPSDEIRIFLDCLRKLTERTWQQLREGTSRDPSRKTGLNPTSYAESHLRGVEWPVRLGQDATIVGVRSNDRMRVFGATIENVFFVLWFDRDHSIVPV